MIPLFGFLRGDTIGLLILGGETDSVADLAEKLQISASLRVKHRSRVKVIFNGKDLAPTLSLKEAGFGPLDRFDVVPAEETDGA
jgi:hypothetical protein